MMRDQYEMEQVMDAVNHENESKVKEQSEQIQNLEQQLNALNQEANADKGASNIIREWIESGEVAIGENGMPNIIRNEESMQEESM